MNDALKKQAETLPRQPGVYVFRDGKGVPLYIGKAIDIARRVAQHLRPPHDTRHVQLLSEATSITFETCSREEEALLREQQLIKTFKPRYNIEWKDGKQYVSVGLRKEAFPRLFVTRQPKLQAGVEYFGPFVDSHAVRSLVRYVCRMLPCCTCATKKQHHCLAWKLERREGRTDTAATVRAIRILMREGVPALRRSLIEQMERASACQQFERAAALRDTIGRLNRLTASRPREVDAADRDRGLQQVRALARTLSLPRMPVRIEGYDISHMSGESSVGSLVVFIDGLPRPDLYRQFRMKRTSGINDVAMLGEVLDRRLKRLVTHPKTWPRPDLLLIDGGKPQLGAAQTALRKARKTIPVVALAKRNEELLWGSPVISLDLPQDHLGLQLAQAIRDEAHRFARKHTRLLHRSKTQQS